MKRFKHFVVLSVLLLGGCGTAYPLPPTPEQVEFANETCLRLNKREAVRYYEFTFMCNGGSEYRYPSPLPKKAE